LCSLGFQGLGYSRAFVENMRSIVEAMQSASAELLLLDGPDSICAACPHLGGNRCGKTDDSEAAIRRADRFVLAAVGMKPGERASAADVFERIAARVSTDDAHSSVCADCEWREHGVCREGLAALKADAGRR